MSILEKLRIVSESHRLYVDRQQALKIELAINLLEDREKWVGLGDKLYNFHANNIFTHVEIPLDQFNYIKSVLEKKS
jgi:hypothetical protein